MHRLQKAEKQVRDIPQFTCGQGMQMDPQFIAEKLYDASGIKQVEDRYIYIHVCVNCDEWACKQSHS